MNLDFIDFVRVYTGLNQKCPQPEWWGETSTEFAGAEDIHLEASIEAIKNAQKEQSRPSLIIGHCVMGKGARKADNSSYEKNCATHGAPLGGDAYINTMKNLGLRVQL